MTADEIVAAVKKSGIGFDESAIRKGWDLNQSQATDKYIAMTPEAKKATCDKAIKNLPCVFCAAPAGRACCLVPPYNGKVLDGYAHTGRWMEYLISEEIMDMVGAPDIGDML